MARPYRRHKRHIEIQVQLGGQKLWANVDTGFLGQVWVSEAIAAHVPFQSPLIPGVDFGTEIGWIKTRSGILNGNLQFGNIALANPALSIGGFENEIGIGSVLLQQFSITIDQKNRRIRFVRP